MLADMRIFDIKALKTCSVVIGSFLVIWCPCIVVINVVAHNPAGYYHTPLSIALLLPAAITVLDPLVYAVMQRNIRRGIRRLFHQGRRVGSQRSVDNSSSTSNQ